jgi:cation diffusion facilitator CzcD-associated flavoprotein CzcO
MEDVIIIGAGPYGLSIAAHLKARGVAFRIFGSAMRFWLSNMPKGMRLKSEGFASSLYDPKSALTLGQYCRDRGIGYADTGLPVALETFSSYGLEFQKRFVPELEDRQVRKVSQSSEGFQVHLEDGEVVAARRVVVAVGLSYYEHIPPVLSGLPRDFMTHSSVQSDAARFKGSEVAVVGAGASAIDLAALLHQAGAVAHVVARAPIVRFHDPPSSTPPALASRLRHPATGIGVGLRLKFCASAPLAFHYLPEHYRLDLVRRLLGPAPGWFVKEQVVGKVSFHLGTTVESASLRNGRIELQLANGSEGRRALVADHVVAATGYRVDLRRLSFLNSDMQARIRSVEQTPILSSNFESSVPGLYFVGATAANAFGPLLRFAFGAGFTARRLSRHLAQVASRHAVRDGGATP